MTFKECSEFRDEIAARVAKIKTRWDQERTLDSPAIRELRSYCARVRPLFAGRYRNVGGKISQMVDTAGRASDGGTIEALSRGLAGIDIALNCTSRRPTPSA
jgi:hypothetical protein